MLFTPEELKNDQLTHVKEESKTSLYKDIREYLTDVFYNKDENIIYATPTDIKEEWFRTNSRVDANYIRRVLKEEFNLSPEEPTSYRPLGKLDENRKGRPYMFKRENYIEGKIENWENEDEPF
jgi:hypothetical protein